MIFRSGPRGEIPRFEQFAKMGDQKKNKEFSITQGVKGVKRERER